MDIVRPLLGLPESAWARAEELDARRTPWLRAYARWLLALDTSILLLVAMTAVLLRFGLGAGAQQVRGIPYLVGALLLLPIWVAALTLTRCYETRFLGSGSDEFKRVADASFRVAAVVVFVAFMTRTEIARGFLAIALVGGLVCLVLGRLGGRLWLNRQRSRGACMHKVVVVGSAQSALEMTIKLQREPMSGMQVVAACVTGDQRIFEDGSILPVLGTPDNVVDVLRALDADTVCVAAAPSITPDSLRRLSYDLEGTGVNLLVSPMLTNVTGSRMTRRAVPGLPLLHIDEPELAGSRRVVKAAFDRVVALVGVLVALPLLLGIAVAIRLTSSGPVFFRQERVGRVGESFRIWKFRTMYVDAETRRAGLDELNVHGEGAILFKLHADPRVTPIGRFLRKYSLDELPQLINVVLGHMSLVGPRPPLRSEVDRYEDHVHRRLLVKPGMTGLWQVSGRADLSWDDAVLLDLHYVENWSLGLDVAVLAKTAMVVLRARGAY